MVRGKSRFLLSRSAADEEYATSAIHHGPRDLSR